MNTHHCDVAARANCLLLDALRDNEGHLVLILPMCLFVHRAVN
jgi:hypothetical protein